MPLPRFQFLPDGSSPDAGDARPARVKAAASTITLRILATTDLHMNLGAERSSGGLARLASVIETQRRVFQNVLLFENGDLIEGTPLGEEIARSGLGAGEVHPAVAALNALGYDAATLGNHDFTHGTAFLRRALRDAAYKVTVANAALLDGPPIWTDSVLLDRRFHDGEGRSHPIRVGVFGVLPPQTVRWEAGLAGRMRTEDVTLAAARAATALRGAGAQVVVALSHGGVGMQGVSNPENAAGEIACLPGIDAVIAGHTHELSVMPSAPGQAPIVTAGCGGSHLAAITLRFDPDEASGPRNWRITCIGVDALPAADQPSPRVIALMKRVPASVIRRLNSPVGECDQRLSSHFSLLGRDSGLRLVDAAARHWLQQVAPEGPPILGAYAPFHTGGRGGPGNFIDIRAGALRRQDVCTLYPFSNRIGLIEISGDELLDWLERAGSIFHRIDGGSEDTPLVDPAFAGFQFDVATGIDYSLDLAQSAAFDPSGRHIFNTRRLTEARHQGRSIRPADRFRLIVNSYRLGGGPLYGALTQGKRCLLPDSARLHMREILTRFLALGPVAKLPETPLFTLTAPPGSTASFDTAPEADPACSPIPVAADSITPQGFRRLVLRF
ncbi:5'-nucleotidase C-terminal domain-containing protein [Paracoccus jeotgali]|nr:5'-nucleotidase C-terminal domain-containing protein [Paracoccus jeotgali]